MNPVCEAPASPHCPADSQVSRAVPLGSAEAEHLPTPALTWRGSVPFRNLLLCSLVDNRKNAFATFLSPDLCF